MRAVSAREFLVRGLLAGLIAGLLAFVVAHLVGEPSLARAIALEGATGEHHAPEPTGTTAPAAESADDGGITRAQQSGPGLLTATVLTGLALGGLLGVLAAVATGRLGRLGPGASTLAVAATGFVAAVLVPFAAYPPQPPGVGSGDTIGSRTFWYLVVMFVSLAAAFFGMLAVRRWQPRLGGIPAAVLGVAGYLVAMVVLVIAVPTYHDVSAAMPATVLWDFRVGSLATQICLWATAAAVLAVLVERRPIGAQV